MLIVECNTTRKLTAPKGHHGKLHRANTATRTVKAISTVNSTNPRAKRTFYFELIIEHLFANRYRHSEKGHIKKMYYEKENRNSDYYPTKRLRTRRGECRCAECGYAIFESEEASLIPVTGETIHSSCWEEYAIDNISDFLVPIRI